MRNSKYKVLFVCVHNSARSQMAEAFLNELDKEHFEAESAGIERGILNPHVVAAMAETGIDISDKRTKAAFDLVQQGRRYDVVITVCDAASREKCPVFPSTIKRIAWSFPDPAGFTGTQEQIMEQIRHVRDDIRQKVMSFIQEGQTVKFWN